VCAVTIVISTEGGIRLRDPLINKTSAHRVNERAPPIAPVSRSPAIMHGGGGAGTAGLLRLLHVGRYVRARRRARSRSRQDVQLLRPRSAPHGPIYNDRRSSLLPTRSALLHGRPGHQLAPLFDTGFTGVAHTLLLIQRCGAQQQQQQRQQQQQQRTTQQQQHRYAHD
jgi:hypothetical protein